MFSIICPTCGAARSVRYARVGAVATCAECRRQFTIEQDQIEVLEDAEEENDDSNDDSDATDLFTRLAHQPKEAEAHAEEGGGSGVWRLEQACEQVQEQPTWMRKALAGSGPSSMRTIRRKRKATRSGASQGDADWPILGMLIAAAVLLLIGLGIAAVMVISTSGS